MPIISNFPTGGSSGGGVSLGALTDIHVVTSHGAVYFTWKDPDDLIVNGTTLAAFGGTILVRKAGSVPTSRRDGTIVLDVKHPNEYYQDSWFCDSGLSDGVTYYYKFFTYTTQNVYSNFDENIVEATPSPVLLSNVAPMSAEAGGNGKVILKWTDPDDTVESGITTAAWGGSKVVYKKGSRPTSANDGTLVLNSTTKNAYQTKGLTISGLDNGEDYYFAVFPYSTEAYGGAINTSASNVIKGVPNRMTIANTPSQSGTLTYTGAAQTPSWNNYDSEKMTFSVTAQTNAGRYTAPFTPKDDYMWKDGTTDTKNIIWRIGKATGSLKVIPETIILNSETKSGSFSVIRSGDGVISATSDATDLFSISVNGNVVTVSASELPGIANITISAGEGTNYFAPSSVECSVSCDFPDPLPTIGTPLDEITWEGIRRISDAGLASSYFSVGDRKSVRLEGTVGSLTLNDIYYCYIIGMDHNSDKEGTNTIHFQFGYNAASGGTHIAFVDSRYNTGIRSDLYFNMNNSYTNSGGWGSCQMRTAIIPAFKDCLPSDLQAVLKTVTKYTDNVGGSSNVASNVTATTDEIFLLAGKEVGSMMAASNSAEQNYQEQYAYYSAGNSKVRYWHSSTGSTANWWLRSAVSGETRKFCYVDTSGIGRGDDAIMSYGFAPAFCV